MWGLVYGANFKFHVYVYREITNMGFPETNSQLLILPASESEAGRISVCIANQTQNRILVLICGLRVWPYCVPKVEESGGIPT